MKHYTVFSPQALENSPLLRCLLAKGFPLTTSIAALVDTYDGYKDKGPDHGLRKGSMPILPPTPVFEGMEQQMHITPSLCNDPNMFPDNFMFNINPYNDIRQNLEYARGEIERHVGPGEFDDYGTGRVRHYWKDALVKITLSIILPDEYRAYLRESA